MIKIIFEIKKPANFRLQVPGILIGILFNQFKTSLYKSGELFSF